MTNKKQEYAAEKAKTFAKKVARRVFADKSVAPSDMAQLVEKDVRRLLFFAFPFDFDLTDRIVTLAVKAGSEEIANLTKEA